MAGLAAHQAQEPDKGNARTTRERQDWPGEHQRGQADEHGKANTANKDMTRAVAHDRPHQDNDDRGEGTSRRDQTERRARAPRVARGRRGVGGGAAPRSGRTWEAPKGHGPINAQPPYMIGQPGRSNKGAEPINNVLTSLPSI